MLFINAALLRLFRCLPPYCLADPVRFHVSDTPHEEGVPVRQGPVDLLAGFQTDGGGQRHRNHHVEPVFPPLRADSLHFDWIDGLNSCRLGYNLAYVNPFSNLFFMRYL